MSDTTDQSETLIALLADEISVPSRTPLYERLAQGLGRAIQNGQLTPGMALPPEPRLAQCLGVSRQTVNRALSIVARRGLLVRRRGAGTFVAEPYVEQSLNSLYSFIRTLTAQGRLPGTRLLGTRIAIDDAASPLLTGQTDGLVFEISRLRLVDGEPFVFEEVYLPLRCGERLPIDRLASEILYDLLREFCDVEVTYADETLRPVVVERTEAALLGLTAGEAAFLVERTGYVDDEPLEFRRSLIRGDRYRFRVRLQGPALAPWNGSDGIHG
jgi:GntR family transcriptional regulator